MTDERAEAERALDAAARLEGPEFFVQFVRTLRVVGVHELENETAKSVMAAFLDRLGTFFAKFGQVQVQVQGTETYFNGVFVRRKGPTIEASQQAIELYERLAISEIAFDRVPSPQETRRFFEVFQRYYRSRSPEGFSAEKFDGIRVRFAEVGKKQTKSGKEKLAERYAELAAIHQDSRDLAKKGEAFPVALLRRGIQELVDASETQQSLLLGLTRLDMPELHEGLHGTAVMVLVLLMCQRLGVPKKHLIQVSLGATILDIIRPEWVATIPESTGELRQASIQSVLEVARFSAADIVERACLAFESTLPAMGDPDGLIPGTAARLLRVASIFQTLTLPPPPYRGLSPEQAFGVLNSAESHFDAKSVRLLLSAIGAYPVGTIVKLSNGRSALVEKLPTQPEKFDRPVVRMIGADGKMEAAVDLAKSPDSLRILGTADAKERKKLNPVAMLLS